MSSRDINSHIIPRHHLKQFANDAGCIFTYPDPDQHTDSQCISKGGGSVIKRTAAKPGYYSQKIEEVLDRKFESQGSKIAQKLLGKQPITLDERNFFATYVASFIYRVPKSKDVLHRLHPNIIKNMQSLEYFREFIESNNIHKIDEVAYFRILNDASSARKDNLVEQAWEYVIESTHQQVYDTLLSRDWWIANAVGSEYFITSDNPLFFSTSNGMADRAIQMTFPLSQKIALVFDGDRVPLKDSPIEHFSVGIFQHNQVDLINQRTANNSTYLYSPKRDVYVQSLLEQRVLNLEPIKRGAQLFN